MIYASKIDNGHLEQANYYFVFLSFGWIIQFLGPSALPIEAVSKNARLLCEKQTETARTKGKSQHRSHIIRDGKGRLSLGFHFFHCHPLCQLDQGQAVGEVDVKDTLCVMLVSFQMD
jgi:hypothetical protein